MKLNYYLNFRSTYIRRSIKSWVPGVINVFIVIFTRRCRWILTWKKFVLQKFRITNKQKKAKQKWSKKKQNSLTRSYLHCSIRSSNAPHELLLQTSFGSTSLSFLLTFFQIFRRGRMFLCWSFIRQCVICLKQVHYSLIDFAWRLKIDCKIKSLFVPSCCVWPNCNTNCLACDGITAL